VSGTVNHLSDHGLIPAAAGIGLRFAHHELVVQARPDVAWFEVHAENYFGGGAARQVLESVRRDYPLSLHGVGLSLGSAEALDGEHLRRLAGLVRGIEPGLVSEHLSWSVVGGEYLADLLPLPMTEEALDVVCRHVEQTQAALQRRILIENPSSYLQFRQSSPRSRSAAAVACCATSTTSSSAPATTAGMRKAICRRCRRRRSRKFIWPVTRCGCWITAARYVSIITAGAWPPRSGRCTCRRCAASGPSPR
jgi:hypothetical protein